MKHSYDELSKDEIRKLVNAERALLGEHQVVDLKSMEKWKVSIILRNMGILEDIKEFDYALPNSYMNTLVDYCKEKNLYFSQFERAEIHSMIYSRFVYAYFKTDKNLKFQDSSNLFCIFPDFIGQKLLQAIGEFAK